MVEPEFPEFSQIIRPCDSRVIWIPCAILPAQPRLLVSALPPGGITRWIVDSTCGEKVDYPIEIFQLPSPVQPPPSHFPLSLSPSQLRDSRLLMPPLQLQFNNSQSSTDSLDSDVRVVFRFRSRPRPFAVRLRDLVKISAKPRLSLPRSSTCPILAPANPASDMPNPTPHPPGSIAERNYLLTHARDPFPPITAPQTPAQPQVTQPDATATAGHSTAQPNNPPEVSQDPAAVPVTVQRTYENCPADINRDEEVHFPLCGLTFPAPSTYDFVGENPFDPGALAVLVGAPWLHPAAYLEYARVSRYVRNYRLPGGLPVDALYSAVWQRCCLARPGEISPFVPHHLRHLSAEQNYVREVYSHVWEIRGTDTYDVDQRVDTWGPRHDFETTYVERLISLPEGVLVRWGNRFIVAQSALLYARTLLPLEFRYLKKGGDRHFNEFVRSELRVRSRDGLLVPGQHREYLAFTPEARRQRYLEVTPQWRRLEVPRGLYAELSTVITYLTSALHGHPESGYWVVVYTEFVAQVAAFVLWDAYDNRRLWALSPDMIRFIRELDLSRVLGSAENFQELLRLVNRIEQKDWLTVPETNSSRSRGARGGPGRQSRRYHVDHSPGKTSAGGDYFHFDPRTNEEITAEEARERGKADSWVVPAGQPTGYRHVPQAELGWSAEQVQQVDDDESESGSEEEGEVGEAESVPEPSVAVSEPSVARFPGYISMESLVANAIAAGTPEAQGNAAPEVAPPSAAVAVSAPASVPAVAVAPASHAGPVPITVSTPSEDLITPVAALPQVPVSAPALAASRAPTSGVPQASLNAALRGALENIR